MKKTIAEKLRKRKFRRANKALYALLVTFVVKGMSKKYGVTVNRKVDMKEYKHKQFILIGNHASRADYIFAATAVGATVPMNFVAGYNEFFRSHLKFIFKLMNAIPKRNFVADYDTIRGVSRVVKNGGNIAIFPEGMNSISGAQQPIVVGSGKFFKHYKLPVLILKTRGGYLTNTKFCMDERPGKVDVTLEELFTPEMLKELTAEQIEDIINKEIYSDDYVWNKTVQAEYNCKGAPAYHIHQLLYKCLHCGKEFHMHGEGDRIYCDNCGEEYRLDNKYNLTKDGKAAQIDTPSRWFDWERREVRKEVSDENFEMSERVSLGMLPSYKYLKNLNTSEYAGEGVLTLNRKGLSYKGTRRGEEFSFFIESKRLPTYGMCTDVSIFYTFADGEYYEFTPLERESTAKWLLATEEVHRLNGGKWQHYPWFDYTI